MGYNTPIVVKEVYLPCDEPWLSGGKTFEDYKKEYGIDLEDIFYTDPIDKNLKIKGFVKINFVALRYDDFITKQAVRSMNICTYDESVKNWKVGAMNFDTGGNGSSAVGLVLDFENKIVQANII